MSNSLSLPLSAFSPTVALAAEDDPEIKRLRSCNPLYVEYAPRWSFYLAAYEGGEEFSHADNLFKHAREAQPDFDDRVKRLDNMNYCEPVVSFFTNFIFAESIDRGGGSNEQFFKTFSSDVSLRGESVDDFMRQVCDDAQIFGMTYVLVDTPPLPESEGEPVLASKQYQEDNNVRPYWVLMHPNEITDWVEDSFGSLVYAKRKQVTDTLDGLPNLAGANAVDPPTTATAVPAGNRVRYEVYTEFFPHYTVISRVDITDAMNPVLSGGRLVFPNSLGEVPIKVARYKRSKKHPHVGLSFLNDFAYNNRRILNITSMLDEFLYRQCFNILAKETDSNIPTREQEDGLLGTSNVLEFPRGAKVPQYITPPSDPAKILQDERGRIITQIYLRASQDTMNELFNGEKSSGFSQAQSFSKTVPFISSRADMLERTEKELMVLTMKLVGKEWDGKIKYKDRYELTNLTSALTQLQVLVKDFQIPSEKFVKTQLKRMVHEYDGKLSVDDQVIIEKQIDAMDFKEWMADQKTAFIGAPKTSPGAQQQPKKDVTLSERETEQGTSGRATVKLQD